MSTPSRITPLRLLLALVLLCGAVPAGADEERETYTWVDENGQRVFSDRPPPAGVQGARLELDVPQPASDPFASLPAADAAQGSSTRDDDQQADEPVQITIVRPTPEETYVNTGYRVQAGVAVEPQLPRGGRVQLYLDGALAATGVPGQQSFLLEDVYRGEHTLTAAVLDVDGRELDRSLPVTFFVRQASLISPP